MNKQIAAAVIAFTMAANIVSTQTKTEDNAAKVATITEMKMAASEESKKSEQKASRSAKKAKKTEQSTERTTDVKKTESGHLTRSGGVYYYNGHRETWYSTREAAGKNTARVIPGKHADENGIIRDADGYVCVASSDHKFFTVIETSWGPGKVYDWGCSHGTIDIYTTW